MQEFVFFLKETWYIHENIQSFLCKHKRTFCDQQEKRVGVSYSTCYQSVYIETAISPRWGHLHTLVSSVQHTTPSMCHTWGPQGWPYHRAPVAVAARCFQYWIFSISWLIRAKLPWNLCDMRNIGIIISIRTSCSKWYLSMLFLCDYLSLWAVELWTRCSIFTHSLNLITIYSTCLFMPGKITYLRKRIYGSFLCLNFYNLQVILLLTLSPVATLVNKKLTFWKWNKLFVTYPMN